MTHPRPVIDADNETFWRGCREHRLLMQSCVDCGTWRFPPRPRCPACRSSQTTWRESAGQGEIVSFTICHPPVLPAFRERTPYNVIVVRLDEGPLLISNLVDADPSVGMRVDACFTEIDGDLTLPQFRRWLRGRQDL
jgi:hypothetical protein